MEPRSKIEAEVVVEFQTASLRDSIKSTGFRLEGQRAGIRIEVPNFLKSDFHVLQNRSYRLKMANKEMKRSVKFDDECYGLMLDVQLPGQEWRRIRPAQARAARRADPSLRSGPSELSLDMIAGAIRGPSHESGGSLSITSLAGPSASAGPLSGDSLLTSMSSMGTSMPGPHEEAQTPQSGQAARSGGSDSGTGNVQMGTSASGGNAVPLGRRN